MMYIMCPGNVADSTAGAMLYFAAISREMDTTPLPSGHRQ